jgi:hypothetical protein
MDQMFTPSHPLSMRGVIAPGRSMRLMSGCNKDKEAAEEAPR